MPASEHLDPAPAIDAGGSPTLSRLDSGDDLAGEPSALPPWEELRDRLENFSEEDPDALLYSVIREMLNFNNKRLGDTLGRCRQHLWGGGLEGDAMLDGVRLASALFGAELQPKTLRGSKQAQRLANQSQRAAEESARKRAKLHDHLIRNARDMRALSLEKTGTEWDRKTIAAKLAPSVGRSERTVYNVIGPAFKD